MGSIDYHLIWAALAACTPASASSITIHWDHNLQISEQNNFWVTRYFLQTEIMKESASQPH